MSNESFESAGDAASPSRPAATAGSTSGYLQLQDASSGEFIPYYFLLQENSLTFADSSPEDAAEDPSMSTAPVGSISLEGSSVEIVPESKHRSPFTFELNCPIDGRVYVLQSQSSAELQDWMNNLRRAMLRIRRDKAKAAAQSRREKREEMPATAIAMTPIERQTPLANSPSTELSSVGPSAAPAATPAGVPLAGADKYTVYRQWLEETKESKQKANGYIPPGGSSRPQTPTAGSGGMHNRLLDENDNAGCSFCGLNSKQCTVM